MLTKADLAAIEARVNAATAARWFAAVRPSSVVGWPVVAQSGRSICSVTYVQHSAIDPAVTGDQAFNKEAEANAMFIAAARQDVPALLAHIRECESEPAVWVQVSPGGNIGGARFESSAAARASLGAARGWKVAKLVLEDSQ